jgi:hypothetical protein
LFFGDDLYRLLGEQTVIGVGGGEAQSLQVIGVGRFKETGKTEVIERIVVGEVDR